MKWSKHSNGFETRGLRILQGRTPGGCPSTAASVVGCVSGRTSDRETKSMNASCRLGAAVAVAALLGVVSPTWTNVVGADNNDRVEICHFPPGNPENYQTITINASALPAHLGHGDFPGPCAND